MRLDYVGVASRVPWPVDMQAAVEHVAGEAGVPLTTGESLRLLAACSRFAEPPKTPGVPDRLSAALAKIGAPQPHVESMLAAVYGASRVSEILASARAGRSRRTWA